MADIEIIIYKGYTKDQRYVSSLIYCIESGNFIVPKYHEESMPNLLILDYDDRMALINSLSFSHVVQ